MSIIDWFWNKPESNKKISGGRNCCPICDSIDMFEERYAWIICNECKALLELVPGGFGEKDTPFRVVETDSEKIKKILGYNYIKER